MQNTTEDTRLHFPCATPPHKIRNQCQECCTPDVHAPAACCPSQSARIEWKTSSVMVPHLPVVVHSFVVDGRPINDCLCRRVKSGSWSGYTHHHQPHRPRASRTTCWCCHRRLSGLWPPSSLSLSLRTTPAVQTGKALSPLLPQPPTRRRNLAMH